MASAEPTAPSPSPSRRRGRGRRLTRRVTHVLGVLLLVSMGTFLMLELLPGDPAYSVLGEGATEAQVLQVRSELHLDDPLPQRYVRWVGDVVQGDFGTSYRNGRPVLETIVERLPVTVELLIVAQVLALGLAIPAAMYAAMRKGGRFDRWTTGAAFTMISAPHFILGVVLIFVFAVRLGWLPATGWTEISASLGDNLRSVVLPAFALSLAPMATYFRLLRSDMISTLQEDFVLLARAKGLSNWYILARHALRPSSFSLMTVAGIQIGRMIGGAVVIEQLFALPGLGRLIVQSIANRDLIVLQGVVLFTALAYIAINMVVDTLYVALDPRTRHAHAE